MFIEICFCMKQNLHRFFTPNDSKVPIKDTFSKVCASYIKHYKESLKEDWSAEDFYHMLFSLKIFVC